MRPAGEISLALLQAVERLWTPERGPTLQELAAAAGVAKDAASQTLKNMTRYERIFICRGRKVPGRNRLAAEYALPHQLQAANQAEFGLSQAMQLWG